MTKSEDDYSAHSKHDEELFGSDMENEKDLDQGFKEQHISQKAYAAIAQENREMKSTIQLLQKQLQNEANTFKRICHQRDQHRSTAKELANQVA